MYRTMHEIVPFQYNYTVPVFWSPMHLVSILFRVNKHNLMS